MSLVGVKKIACRGKKGVSVNDAERLAAWRARQRAEFGRFDEAAEDFDEGLSVGEAEALKKMRAYVHGVDACAELVN